MGVLGESDQFSSPQMKTPNLDALASKSLVLTKAYTQVALCGPSRSSFLTGRRPDTVRCYVSENKARESVPDIITMPQYFKENGYLTLGTGKIFHPGEWCVTRELWSLVLMQEFPTPTGGTTFLPPGPRRYSTLPQRTTNPTLGILTLTRSWRISC